MALLLEGYGKGQYFIDPCRFQLITPGIDVETGEYEGLASCEYSYTNYFEKIN